MSEQDEQHVGSRIKAMREAAGLSQIQLAHLAETNQQTVQRIEAGLTNNSRATPKILRALRNYELRTSDSQDDITRIYLADVDRKQIQRQTRKAKKNVEAAISDDGARAANSIFPKSKPMLYFYREIEPGLMSVTEEQSVALDIAYIFSIMKNVHGMYVPVSDMEPEFEPGDILLIDKTSPPIPDTSCVFFSRAGSEEIATIKRIVASTKDEWIVKSWSPAREIRLPKESWATCLRIIGKISRR